MNASFTKAFNKQFKKLPAKQQAKAQTAVILFLEHPKAPSLRNHALTGKWSSSVLLVRAVIYGYTLS